MRRQLGRGSQVQFAHDARAVLAHGEFGYLQRFGDAPAIHHPADQRHYLLLPAGNTRHARHARDQTICRCVTIIYNQ